MNVKLKTAIWEAGWTQLDVAQRASMGENKLSRIIHGRDVATPQEQKRIAKALKRPVSELFGVLA